MEEISQLLPALELAAYEALRASIAGSGVRVPVIVSAGPASLGEIADGVHRLRACAELGLECPGEQRSFESELELRLFQLETNLHRRQLSPAWQIRTARLLEPLLAERAARRKAQAKGKRRGEKALPPDLAGERGETRELVAELVGLKRTSYMKGREVLEQGSPKLVRELEQGRESIDGAYRRLKEERRRQGIRKLAAELRAAPPEPLEGGYEVVALDPPWPYEGSKLPYPTMPLEAIAALPIPKLVAEHASVWLWTTNHFLPAAFALIEQWGLAYRETLTWGKHRIGRGSYLRGQTEHVVFATKGTPPLTLASQSTLLLARAREHSRKPDEFYALVESLCPGRKLELFARERRPGWAPWGAEPDLFTPEEAP